MERDAEVSMDRNHDMQLAQDLVDEAMELAESTSGSPHTIKMQEAARCAVIALAIFARWDGA